MTARLIAAAAALKHAAAAMTGLAIAVVLAANAQAATLTVTVMGDPVEDGCAVNGCSLREAVQASVPADGDTIVLPAGATPYLITQGRIAINKAVTIVGGGARSTVLDGGDARRAFVVDADGSLTLSAVTLRNFHQTAATGVISGGAIDLRSGELRLSDSALLDNDIESLGADNGDEARGGALSVGIGTTATLSRVLIAGNTARGGTASGGAINSYGTLVIGNSTITGNTATGSATGGTASFGGGMNTTGVGGTQTVLDRVTITSNTATGGYGGNVRASAGTTTTTILRNSIIAGGVAAPGSFGQDCLRTSNESVFVSEGRNLDSHDDCGLSSGDLRGTDPRLGPLGNDGGPTDTLPPLAGSPILDAGLGCSPDADQRGLPHAGACDLGALEAQRPVATAAVSSAGAAPGQEVTFTVAASDADARGTLVSSWAFDDGAAAVGVAVSHAFTAAGQHGATVTVTDELGRTATATATVAVVLPPPFVAPPDPRDALAPTITKFRLDRRSFPAARSGATVRSARTYGAAVRYTLSEAAKVTFTIEQARDGRRSGGRCQTPTRGNRRGKACTRYVKLKGGFSHDGRAGSNTLRFTGRLSGRQLGRHSYRLLARATDPAGNRSATATASFKIIK